MNRHLFSIAFLLGAAAILWVGTGFVGTQWLALLMTMVIAVVYGFGALELRQFRQTSAGLSRALASIPEPLTDLEAWLTSVPLALQNPVRLRIQGERVGLPGPALTPYLVGLLVMLGMLGTFLGMVVTLNGAAFSLEGTTDLQTIRTALAAPIKGLGLAFGTSVAGVAASAMLGLMSALSRRERMGVAQALDNQIATRLRRFSLTYQRQETYAALQAQTQALPAVVNQLQAMMAQMERSNEQLNAQLERKSEQLNGQMERNGGQLNAQLLGQQDRFHSEVKLVYRELAASVDQSLRDSLTHSARLVGESIQPVLAAAMDTIAQDASQMHQRVLEAAQTQVEGLSLQLGATARDITAFAQTSADQTLGEITRLITSAEDLIRARVASEADWVKQNHAHMAQLTSLLGTELGALRDQEAQRGQAAVARLGELQTALASHLTTLGTALEEPIQRLIQSAAEAPRAAAEVIGQLRQQMSGSIAQDNALLQERTQILETLNALLGNIQHASTEQRAVIDTLVASSKALLNQAGSQFSERVELEAAKLSGIAAQVTSGAVEVSSLGETLGFAVNTFHAANEKLIGQLQRIEGALEQSMTRSDEQLAYYVAQAREVIDLSLLSQKEIFEALRQLPGRQTATTQELN